MCLIIVNQLQLEHYFESYHQIGKNVYLQGNWFFCSLSCEPLDPSNKALRTADPWTLTQDWIPRQQRIAPCKHPITRIQNIKFEMQKKRIRLSLLSANWNFCYQQIGIFPTSRVLFKYQNYALSILPFNKNKIHNNSKSRYFWQIQFPHFLQRDPLMAWWDRGNELENTKSGTSSHNIIRWDKNLDRCFYEICIWLAYS